MFGSKLLFSFRFFCLFYICYPSSSTLFFSAGKDPAVSRSFFSVLQGPYQPKEWKRLESKYKTSKTNYKEEIMIRDPSKKPNPCWRCAGLALAGWCNLDSNSHLDGQLESKVCRIIVWKFQKRCGASRHCPNYGTGANKCLLRKRRWRCSCAWKDLRVSPL